MPKQTNKILRHLFFAFIMLSSLAAMAQPKANWIDRSKNAGTLNNTGTATVEYLVRNDGDKPLQIIFIRPSCSCLTSAYDSVIAPKKTGKIKVTINLAGQSGKTYRGLIVKTNDPAKSTIELNLEYTVVAKTSTSGVLHHPGQEEVSWAIQRRPSFCPGWDVAL